MPVRVERPHQGEDIVATVLGDDITIGGQRSAVESFIKMISKKYEIKKQVLGETQTSRTAGEYPTASLSGIVTASLSRQIRGMSER